MANTSTQQNKSVCAHIPEIKWQGRTGVAYGDSSRLGRGQDKPSQRLQTTQLYYSARSAMSTVTGGANRNILSDTDTMTLIMHFCAYSSKGFVMTQRVNITHDGSTCREFGSAGHLCGITPHSLQLLRTCTLSFCSLQLSTFGFSTLSSNMPIFNELTRLLN